MTKLLVVLGLLLAGCGGGARTVTETVTVDRDAGSEDAGEPVRQKCSADQLVLTLPEQADLPAPVAQTRSDLFEAALDCDFETLGSIAARNEDGFGFSFDDEEDPVAAWREADGRERTLDRLARLLTAPVVVKHEGGVTYAWPSVYTDAPTDEDYEALIETGAYTRREATAFQADGSYVGYRISIKADGTWNFYTVGD